MMRQWHGAVTTGHKSRTKNYQTAK